jgi:phosphate-selective porin
MKKGLLMVMCAAALIGMGQEASAKSLEEILKEKGIITEEDYKEATKKSDLAYYKPGRGITIESSDGKNVAHVGGRLQARYAFVDFDDEAKDNDSEFSIRRMKVWLQGNVFSKNLKYKWQQNFGEGKSVTEDAFVSYRLADPLTLQVGQYKAPQGRQELTSSGSQLFVDRSLANDTFNLGRDIGLMAAGHFADHLVEYRAGVFNGNGPNEGNEEDNHMFSARIDINPLGAFKMDEPAFDEKKPLLNIGASYAMEKMTAADAGSIDGDNDVLDKALDINDTSAADFTANFGDELEWSVWTANLHAKWMGATLGAEYYSLDAEPELGADWDADGYYVQAGYQIIPKTLELAARYSAIESTDNNAFERFDKSETQVGVNYYFAKHNAKLQADYTMVNDDLTKDRDDNIFRLQAQVIF